MLAAIVLPADRDDSPPHQVLLLIDGRAGYREVRETYIDSDGDLIIVADMDVTE